VQDGSVNLYSSQIQPQEHEETKLPLTPAGYLVLTSQVLDVERQ
jgi:hypothetical protein